MTLRLYEYDEETCAVIGWPDPRPVTRGEWMPVRIDTPLGLLWHIGRHQFDGNRPPVVTLHGVYHPVAYAEANVTENDVAHGLTAA